MSQTDTVLRHLRNNRHITPLEAFGLYGIFRLAARVHDLRGKGHDIRTEVVDDPNGKPYARYSLFQLPAIAA